MNSPEYVLQGIDSALFINYLQQNSTKVTVNREIREQRQEILRYVDTLQLDKNARGVNLYFYRDSAGRTVVASDAKTRLSGTRSTSGMQPIGWMTIRYRAAFTRTTRVPRTTTIRTGFYGS